MYYTGGLTVHQFMVSLIFPPGINEIGLLGRGERGNLILQNYYVRHLFPHLGIWPHKAVWCDLIRYL